MRYVKGVPVKRFERIAGMRAECLDATIYAMAARHLVGLDLERRAAELASPTALPARIPMTIKSAWLNR